MQSCYLNTHSVALVLNCHALFTLHWQVELVCRVGVVLVQLHHYQLVSTLAARPLLIHLKDILHRQIKVIIFWNLLSLYLFIRRS